MGTIHESFFEENNVGPSDEAAFRFFYGKTLKEGLPVQPEFAWDQFEEGIAPFNNDPKAEEDTEKLAASLIPNYTWEQCKENDTYPAIAFTRSIGEGFIHNLETARQETSARIIGIHPTLASPLLYARAIGAAYQQHLGKDIRKNLFITFGAYPTTMRYDFGEGYEISPTTIGRSLGNVVLTAPRSESTLTDDETVKDWMNAKRTTFKLRNNDLLEEPGNIVIVIPSGTRGEKSKSTREHVTHKEFLPDGNLDYITEYDTPSFVMGVGDSLLVDPKDIGSIVTIGANPTPYEITSMKTMRDALVESSRLVSTQAVQYAVEGINDQRIRTGKDSISRLIRRKPPGDQEQEG